MIQTIYETWYHVIWLMVFSGYDQRLEILTDVISMWTSVPYYQLYWVWRNGNIYNQYRAMLSLIHDQTMTLEHGINLIKTYINPLSVLFDDEYTFMTFYMALTNTDVISKSVSIGTIHR